LDENLYSLSEVYFNPTIVKGNLSKKALILINYPF